MGRQRTASQCKSVKEGTPEWLEGTMLAIRGKGKGDDGKKAKEAVPGEEFGRMRRFNGIQELNHHIVTENEINRELRAAREAKL